jgi:hypothetical protein
MRSVVPFREPVATAGGDLPLPSDVISLLSGG